MYKIVITLAAFFSIITVSFAQWSSNPAVNLQISDLSGDQATPKISKTTDGGCYIVWFDHRGSNYDVYLQRLNALGVKQFSLDGLLISSNPQSSSLVDFDIITDDSNNAVIAFTDTRNGSAINPFAYRISPAGTFLWGANGVSLSTTNSTYQANPKVIQTSDNNFVIVWIFSSTPNKIAMQKLNFAGVKQWGNDPLYLNGSTNEHFTYPAMVRSDNGSVIMMWSGYGGTFINPTNYKLYSQKFSSAGTPAWNSTQDTIYSLGRVSGFYVPRIFPDTLNGAIYCWRDDRNSTNLATGYLQRQNSVGTYLFPVNGSAVSTLGGMNHFDPVAAYMSSSGETYAFFSETNVNQNQFGVYGQKFSPTGSRLWTDNGMAFVPLNQNQPSFLWTYTNGSSIVCDFSETQFGSSNTLIKNFKVSNTGTFLWTPSIVTSSTYLSPKIRMQATMNSAGMSMMTWSDGRNDGGGIYAQNINWDGTLGNIVGIQNNQTIPTQFELYQNYPNPFNPTTKIKFDIPGTVTQISNLWNTQLIIYNSIGQQIAALVNENLKPGSYEIILDVSNYPCLRRQASGVYFYKLTSGNFTDTKKLILIK